MNARVYRVLAFAAAALLVAPFAWAAAGLSAQDAAGRFRVIVPRFFPDEGSDDDFGRDTAERIREALEALPSYTAMEEDEIEDQLDEYDMDMNDLIAGELGMEPCLGFRQLGNQLGTEVAVCVNYRETGDDMVELYNIQFWQIRQQQSFDLDPFTIHRDDDEGAAEQIMARFDDYVQLQRYRTFCYDYAQAQNWEDALRNCDLALDANPDDVSVRAQRAYVYQEMGDLEQSLQDLETVLEADAHHESALQRAGFVATTLGRNEEGRSYYSRYLELNPGAVGVRRNIAHASYEAGDALGAMLLVEEGLEVEPDNVSLLLDYGNYAFVAAADRNPGQSGQQEAEALPAEVAELYGNALEAYMQVYENHPDTMSVGALRNVVVANIQLENLDDAVAVGERVTQSHQEEASLWSIYADALRRSGNLDAAVQAMTEVERLDPDYQGLYARQGMWMLEAGRIEEAVPFLQRAVERGQSPDNMARNLLSRAHGAGTREGNFPEAIEIIALAKESFEVGPEARRELDFWHGYFIYQQGVQDQEPATLETARATLPRFQEARRLFEAARGYTANGSVDIDQYVGNTDTYIEIQEAIIQRGGG